MYLELVNYSHLKQCNVIDSSSSTNSFNANIQTRNEVVEDSFANLKKWGNEPVTFQYHTLNHVAENKLKFGLHNTLDPSPHKHFNFDINTLMWMTFVRNGNIVGKLVKDCNSFTFHSDTVEQKVRSSRKTVLTGEWYEINF